MNKTLYWILGIILVLITGFILLNRQSAAPPQHTSSTDTTPTGTETSDGRYLTYSDAAFASANDRKRVLFFHAPWCPTCRPADAEFQKRSAEIPEDVILFKTDYDTSTELKRKYNVTYQHTYVQVDADGNEVTTWNGGALSELINNVR